MKDYDGFPLYLGGRRVVSVVIAAAASTAPLDLCPRCLATALSQAADNLQQEATQDE
jgi:hypothetical protein